MTGEIYSEIVSSLVIVLDSISFAVTTFDLSELRRIYACVANFASNCFAAIKTKTIERCDICLQ